MSQDLADQVGDREWRAFQRRMADREVALKPIEPETLTALLNLEAEYAS